MENLLVDDLMANVGHIIVFWVNNLRFEGKVLAVDKDFLKYFDTHKNKERFVKISEIENLEIENG